MATTARHLTPLLLLIVSPFAASQGEGLVVSEQCLHCLCVANGCDTEKVCGDGERNCGPFQISEPFWVDAYKPVIPGDLPTDLRAFQRCADDIFCSAKAVEAYMGRFPKDCNGDGSVDCMDFMLIHQHGPGACGGDRTVAPVLRFIACWNSIKEANSTTQTLPS
uniref:lysozyme n=1 Tax=Locusta migratoria TaxID=7004 RepID=A0A1J0M172_LOCMI|nr:i-type lysozyme [Locusta migratoria]